MLGIGEVCSNRQLQPGLTAHGVNDCLASCRLHASGESPLPVNRQKRLAGM
jgi:hypothetical protein